MGRVNALSWNRSILAPYILSAGASDSCIWNHDVRCQHSLILMQRLHVRELINVQWSANSSYEMMRTSDASNLFLASSSITGDLACSRMSEMKANWAGHLDLARVDQPYFYE